MDMSFFEELGFSHQDKGRAKHDPSSSFLKGSLGSKSSPTSGNSDTYLPNQGNSTSDEYQQIIDDRKQRRMLSNRESARRSRLRKQQHLDELRDHVAQLRAQNNQMLTRFSLTLKHYAQLTEENRILRGEATDLSHKLQSLHHTVVSKQDTCGLRYSLNSEQAAQTFEVDHLAPYS